MKRLFSALFLFFLSSLAWAGDNPLVPRTADAVENGTDMSVDYLSQVFGNVGSTLHTSSGHQMLGQLLKVFNEGVLLVAGLWLAYTIFSTCIRSAADGSFMGQNKNVFWVLIRIALAFALLLPSATTGYNLIQEMVMKVVVQGVVLADNTWDYALDYLAKGGEIWDEKDKGADAAAQSNGVHIVNMNLFMQQSTYPLLHFLQKEVCMMQSSIVSNTSPQTIYHVVPVTDDQHRWALFFPGNGDHGDYEARIKDNFNSDAKDKLARYDGNPDATNLSACGQLVFSQIQALEGGPNKPPHNPWVTNGYDDIPPPPLDSAYERFAAASDIALMAAQKLSDDLLPIAKALVCSEKDNQFAPGFNAVCHSDQPKPFDYDSVSSQMWALMHSYLTALQPFAPTLAPVTEKYSPQETDDTYSRAKQAGWVMAGRYYWDLSILSRRQHPIPHPSHPFILPDYNKIFPNARYIPEYAPMKIPNNVEYLLVNSRPANYLDIGGWWPEYGTNIPFYTPILQKVKPLEDHYINASHASNNMPTDPDNPKADQKHILIKLLTAITPALDNIYETIDLFSHVGADPMLFLTQLGAACMGFAAAVWLEGGLAIIGLVAAGSWASAFSSIGFAIKAGLDWFQPLFLTAAAALLGVGVLLQYYVPLYPFMLFLFGVVGWLIMVIEAMVAAPLIAFGLTHPEGHDFLGEAKQGLMLLLSVFLRPVLMVIGLVAGMILAYVAFKLLVFSYTGFLEEVFAGHTLNNSTTIGASLASSGNILGAAWNADTGVVQSSAALGGWTGAVMMFVIGMPIFLVMFAGLAYVITNQCFSMIYVLPDYILRWIGGPQHAASVSAGEMARQVQGITGQAGSAASEGAGKFSEATNKEAKQRLQQGETKRKGATSEHEIQ